MNDINKVAGILLGEDLYKVCGNSVRDLFPDEAENIARTILKALNQKSEGIAEGLVAAMMDKPDAEGCSSKELRRVKSECEWIVKEPSPEVKVYCESTILATGSAQVTIYCDVCDEPITSQAQECKKVKKQTLLEFVEDHVKNIDVLDHRRLIGLISEYLESEARVGSSSI